MVNAKKVSSIKIDTGYAGVKEYPFFTKVMVEGGFLKMLNVLLFSVKMASGKSTIARVLSSENSDVKFLTKKETSLEVIIRISMFLTNGLLVKIFA